MRAMGVDISTKTGVAVIDAGKKVVHASQIEFPKLKGLERAGHIAEAVRALWFKYSPDLVVIEDYVHSSHSIVTSVEIGTLVRFSLYMEDAEPWYVPPTTLKKFVSGKGGAKKDMMLLHIFKRWGITPSTDNIGDAIGLAMMGLCAMGETFPSADRKCVQDSLKGFAQKTTVQLIAVD